MGKNQELSLAGERICELESQLDQTRLEREQIAQRLVKKEAQLTLAYQAVSDMETRLNTLSNEYRMAVDELKIRDSRAIESTRSLCQQKDAEIGKYREKNRHLKKLCHEYRVKIDSYKSILKQEKKEEALLTAESRRFTTSLSPAGREKWFKEDKEEVSGDDQHR